MGHAARSSRRESHAAASGGAARRQHVKSGVLLLVAAVSLYGLLPTLASVVGSWRSLARLDWAFAVPPLAPALSLSAVPPPFPWGCVWGRSRAPLACPSPLPALVCGPPAW